MSDDERQYLTRTFRLAEVASMLSIAPETLRRMVNRGQFPAPIRTPNGLKLWSEQELVLWMNARLAERDMAIQGGRMVDMRQAHDELAALHARQSAERAASRGKDGT